MSLIISSNVSARISINPEPPPPFFPDNVRNYLENADAYPQTPAYAPWISVADQPHVTTVNVPSTATSVNLEYHIGAIIGWSHPAGGTSRAHNRVVGISTNIPGHGFSGGITTADRDRVLDYQPTQNTPGTFRHAGRYFTYTAPAGGFTAGIHTITISQKAINNFSNGTYQCVGGSEAVVTSTGFSDASYAQCQTGAVTIQINVIRQPSGVNVQGRVYNAVTGAVVPGVSANTCNYGTVVSNGGGDLLFTANSAAAYCLRITGVPAGYDIDSVRARPAGGQGYLECTPDQPPTGVTCTRTTYECQTPGAHTPSGCGGADRNTDVGFDFVIRPLPAGSTVDCPPMPDPTVDVTLSDLRSYPASGPSTPGSVSGASTWGYGSLPPDQYQDVNESNPYRVNSAQDEWGQQPGMQRPIGVRGGNQVEVDYTPFIRDYPYDYHNPTLNYTQFFTRYRYTASRTSAYSHVHDPPPYCTNYAPTYDRRGNITGYRCTSYYDPPPYTEYHWTDSYSLAGTTPHSPSNYMSPPQGGLVTLHRCYDRTYDTTNITFGQVTMTPDRESPNQATLSATINVNFNVQRPDLGLQMMRRASEVTYPIDVTYQIMRSNGSMSGGGTVINGQNLRIVATSTSKQSQGSGGVGTATAVSVEANASDLRVGDRVCWTVRVRNPFEQGRIDAYGNRVTSNGTHAQTECSVPVVNWPYLEVYGNDVVSGGSFTGGCSTGSHIRSWHRNGQFRGASTQYAVFALGSINGFTSASLRQGASGNAQAPLGLTFSNTTSGTHGGGYQANDGISCLPNFFASRPANPVPTAMSTASIVPHFNAANADPTKIEYHESPGDYTINTSGPGVRNGVRKVFYINGTLNINSDIPYQSTSWTNHNDIPFVMFIARDINIAPGVTRLDGVYVAQPNGGGSGTINTCTTIYASCRNPLIINGAFYAERVNFYRTRGSLRNAVENEGRAGVSPGVGGNNNCSSPWGSTQSATNTGAAGGNTCGAEIFSFSPEIYISLSQILIPEDNFILDSYITLPPNL